MSTTPETAPEPADSNKCICCKRSKSGGSFFEVKPCRIFDDKDVPAYFNFEYEGWDADIEVFQEASRQGCQRCAVAFDIVTTWMEANPSSEKRHISVWNRNHFPPMAADVGVCFSESRAFHLFSQEMVVLELLSANHRNPVGLVENFRDRWNIVTKPLSYEDPTSDDGLQECIKCLRDCLDNHTYCSNTLNKLPKRVLELKSTSIRLRDTTSIPSKELYACLSHCWGPKGPSLQLTSATETRLRQGVELHRLPRTFSETARVCMKLGIRFLWIDALCIIQGEKDDWAEAAATMADVYENAFVTIAATCAANSDDGLRPDRFKALRLGSSNFFVREHILDRSKFFDSNRNNNWPLMSRAWVFQESRLAPRTLRFSCHGVIWDCRTTKAEEEKKIVGRDLDNNTVDLLPFFSSMDSASDPEKAWLNTVTQYSTLDLTYRTDTLPAIAALAQRMARLRRNDTYLAGMWRSTLLSDIQWRVLGEYPRQETSLPTWSWASIRGAHYIEKGRNLQIVEVLGLDYTPVGPAEIGVIKNAVLTIRGPTSSLQVHASSSYGFEVKPYQQIASWPKLFTTCCPDHKFFPNFYLDGNPSFLVLFTSIAKFKLGGLVLRQVGTVYERVGWCHVHASQVDIDVQGWFREHLAQLPLTTVRII